MTLTVNGQLVVDQAYTYAIADAFTYDNLWTYAWNNENRLVAAEKSGAGVPPANCLIAAEKSGAGVPPANRLRLEFVYDSQGRRRIKKVRPVQ